MPPTYPGAVLDLALQGGYYPPEDQAALDALIAEIRRSDDDPEALSPHLRALYEATPPELPFLAYACDIFGLHKAVTRAYREQDWDSYVFTHPDYLRLFALLYAIECGLEGAKYWELLTSVYTLDDHSSANKYAYLGLYLADEEPGRRAAMNDAELAVFDALPEVVTLYRGARSEQRRGLSWTLERKVAAFFAERVGGAVHTVQLPRDALLVYYDRRKEAEVLVDLDALSEYHIDVAPRGSRRVAVS